MAAAAALGPPGTPGGASVSRAGPVAVVKPSADSVLQLKMALIDTTMRIHAAGSADSHATDRGGALTSGSGSGSSMEAVELLVAAVTAAVSAGPAAGLLSGGEPPMTGSGVNSAHDVLLPQLAAATVELTAAVAAAVEGAAAGDGAEPGVATPAVAVEAKLLRLIGGALRAINRMIKMQEAARLAARLVRGSCVWWWWSLGAANLGPTLAVREVKDVLLAGPGALVLPAQCELSNVTRCTVRTVGSCQQQRLAVNIPPTKAAGRRTAADTA